MTRIRGRKPVTTPTGQWLRVSHEITWEIEDMIGLPDLDKAFVVKMSPDAGFDDSAFDDKGNLILGKDGKPVATQHPGVTFPEQGIIEINAKYLPEDVTPDMMSPLIRRDHQNYPVIWGLVAHEAAHARCSKWLDKIDGKRKRDGITQEEKNALGAATLLEESRIERKQMDFRPQDQVWLSASGTKLALDEVKNQIAELKAKGELEGDINKIAASRSAALVLARIDAGSVYEDDATDEIQKLVDDAFGQNVAKQLRNIWLEAQDCGDYDTDTMMRLGKKWYELTGDPGNEPQNGDESGCSSCQGDGEGGGQSAIEAALAEAAGNSEADANGQAEAERNATRIGNAVSKRQAEAKAQQEAEKQGRACFAGKGNNYNHPVRGYRDPTMAELTLARTIRRALQAAYVPERAITKVTRTLPPGRLSTRSAMQLDAQQQLGLLPDVEPFQYKDRMHVPTPPLKVGIIQDVSGSQGSAAAAACSGAWCLAKACTMITDAQVCMVSFGDAVHKIFGPHEKLPKVPTLSTNYGTDYFLQALQAVEGGLQLTRQGSARLVVILTDGYWSTRDHNGRDAAIKRLAEQGVKFLWLVTDGGTDSRYYPAKMRNVHVFTKAAGHFDVVPRVIGQEAVNALKKQ